MASAKLYDVAHKSLDPLGVIGLFGYILLRKFTGFELTQDELLVGSMALGSFRILWERNHRKLIRTVKS